MAVVVLLPFVPVMQTTRSRSASASHNPRPPVTGTPAASRDRRSARVREMPGDLTTTSQPASSSRPPDPVARTSSVAGRSSTITCGGTPSAASFRMFARPSTPRPQTPTVRSRRSDQEIVGGIRRFDEVLAHRGEVPIGRSRRGRLLGAQLRQDGIAGSVGAAGRPPQRDPALADVPHALERLGRRGVAEQPAEPREQVRPVQRLPATEDGPQLLGRHERGEDQVDECALVALAAPCRRAQGRVDVEGAIATAEHRVVLGKLREPLGDPQLRIGPQRREVAEPRQGGVQHPAEALLEVEGLRVLVVDPATVDLDGGGRRRPLVAHDHRAAMVEHGGEDGDGGEHPGHRHVTVEEAEFVTAEHLGVQRPAGPHARQAGDRGGVLDRVEPADDEQAAFGEPALGLFDDNDGVDATAGGNQRPFLRQLPWPRVGHIGAAGDDLQVVDRELVDVAELTEALDVELTEEGDLVLGDRGVAQVDHGGSGGLVVRDTAQQEEDPRRRGDTGLVPVQIRGEVDDLPEGPAVEGVPRRDLSGGGLDVHSLVGERPAPAIIVRHHLDPTCRPPPPRPSDSDPTVRVSAGPGYGSSGRRRGTGRTGPNAGRAMTGPSRGRERTRWSPPRRPSRCSRWTGPNPRCRSRAPSRGTRCRALNRSTTGTSGTSRLCSWRDRGRTEAVGEAGRRSRSVKPATRPCCAVSHAVPCLSSCRRSHEGGPRDREEMTMVGMPQSTALMTRPAEVQPAEAHDGQGMPPSRRPAAALVDRAVEVNQQIAPTLLRLSLATVFVWFGALKLVGSSPVHELIAATLPFVDADISVPVLGVVEIVLGLALASRIFPRITLLVLSGLLAGTFLTFLTASELMWTGNLLNLTADGEFVVKNLVLITSALVLIGHYSLQAQSRRTA